MDITIIIGIVIIVYLLLKWHYNYWKRLGLENPKPTLLLGNTYDIFTLKLSFGGKVTEWYNEMKAKGQKHFGIYFLTVPMYVPVDPEIIKLIMQKDFQYFMDRGVYVNEEADPLSAHLFSLEGTKWRNLRVKLTPTFTSNKMKMMFPTVVAAAKELISILDKTNPDESIEMKDILARLTTDIIGSCAFGIECNSLKDPDTEFRKVGKKVFKNDKLWKNITDLLSFIWPGFMASFNYNFTSPEVEDFFMKVVKDTVEYREKTNFYRKDFMQLLLQLKNRGTVNDDGEKMVKASDKITFNEMVAQAFIFFLAGFETSSSTMAFCLYELSLNQEIQQKVRDEINQVLDRFEGEMPYEALTELRYMEMVVDETMRKYPTLPVLNRVCTKDYTIPGFGVTLKKGTKVLIPVEGLHRDPEHYQDPDCFNPTRFTEENKNKRQPYTYLPFGEGPRVCIDVPLGSVFTTVYFSLIGGRREVVKECGSSIGLRFGMMQVKIGLSVLLKNYKFTLNPKTPVPLKLDPTNFLNSPLGGIWMNIQKIHPQKNK